MKPIEDKDSVMSNLTKLKGTEEEFGKKASHAITLSLEEMKSRPARTASSRLEEIQKTA